MTDRPATEPRPPQMFDPLAVMVGEFARDFVEPTARMDAIDRLYSMLNEARAEAAQGAAPLPICPVSKHRSDNTPNRCTLPWLHDGDHAFEDEGAAPRSEGHTAEAREAIEREVAYWQEHPEQAESTRAALRSLAAPRAEGSRGTGPWHDEDCAGPIPHVGYCRSTSEDAPPEPHRDYAGRTCTTGLLHDHSEGAAPRAEGLPSVEALAKALVERAPGFYAWPEGGSRIAGAPYKINAVFEAEKIIEILSRPSDED